MNAQSIPKVINSSPKLMYLCVKKQKHMKEEKKKFILVG